MSLTLRRLRQDPWIRELTQGAQARPQQMIQPLFVVDGISKKEPVPGLTGVFRETPESLISQVESDLERGVRKFLLFGVPEKKQTQFDFTAAQIQAIKSRFKEDLWLSADVCLCSYTSHGHCGVLEKNQIQNSASVELLVEEAKTYAEAGVDCVAPSDMMDGRISAIRSALDGSGHEKTLLMSYSSKFHSRFYGPFRVAADSAPSQDNPLKDRATYQIDPSHAADAIRASLRDEQEGADILMVKPGLPYLDIVYRLSQASRLPIAIYETSGEFASIELLNEKGLTRGPGAHLESWTSMVRAGASIIISYGTRSAKKWLEETC